ncbi:MAG: GNAT family N-acetyltransferase [Gemmatimonadales bacterium]
MTTDMTMGITLRPARASDIDGITSLVNSYAAESIMLYRSPESVRVTLHDFVVAVGMDGAVMACGALKEYSPSLAEVASVAVAREAHGLGLGTAIVGEVERLARKRGVDELFALTLTPKFFESAGYVLADRALYPEKIRRDCLKCPRRIRCNEYCVVRSVQEAIAVAA